MNIRARHAIAAALCSAAMAIAAPLAAQDQAPKEPDNEIVVEGEIDVDRGDARDQTRDITPRPTSAQEPLARFNKEICPGVWGLAPENAQIVIDRIYDNAEKIGVPVNDAPDCGANVWVIVVDDPHETFKQLRDKNDFLVRGMGYWERERIEKQDGAALSWNLVSTRSRGGLEAVQGANSDAVNETTLMSRTNTAIRQDIELSVVLVRRSELATVDALTLADYATMRGLAKTEEPNESLAFDTVLGAFGPARDVTRLSVFDLSYLRALYRSSPTRDARLALTDVERLMEEEYARMEAERTEQR
ncbi:hypothetical protein [Aurantiacibacter rhizosphaerae]|uniref:DUF2927 domain-containing protein n=1 Tax=Aurantiacibacter rhizosphaerae TaxID=2691582 RepID=A0A844XI27_9SPHN|nr:hypothetical protein [Aurantiacibacter rhizosphaerae]MWV29214.1 hypothetical protein [Aurantiacibacter rhizosphaerae]